MAQTPEELGKLYATLRAERAKKNRDKANTVLARFDRKADPLWRAAAAEHAAAEEAFMGVCAQVSKELREETHMLQRQRDKFAAEAAADNAHLGKLVAQLQAAVADCGALGGGPDMAAFTKQLEGLESSHQRDFLEEMKRAKAASAAKLQSLTVRAACPPAREPPAPPACPSLRPPPPAYPARPHARRRNTPTEHHIQEHGGVRAASRAGLGVGGARKKQTTCNTLRSLLAEFH